MNIYKLDLSLIRFFHLISVPVARIGLFTIFFWFGILKVVGLSPASPLVHELLSVTMPQIPFTTFVVFLGVFECIIGILFLIKGLERVVIPVLCLHMITKFLPLFLLPHSVWILFGVPTMEGQYIIKNLVIIATAIGIAAHLHPLHKKI